MANTRKHDFDVRVNKALLDFWTSKSKEEKKKIAAKANVHPISISNIAYGHSTPSVAFARKVSGATEGELSVAQILNIRT
jgi:hypothetical protein